MPRRPSARPADQSGFLAAISAAPDDDNLRLVFADWLQEHDDPDRAEFIRLQIDHARTYGEALSVSGDRDCARMEELEEQHRAKWLAHLPKIGGLIWGFWRGLPGMAHFPGWQEFNRHADRLFASAPVEYVGFNCLSLVGARALAKSPYLERIRVLDLAYALRKIGALRALLASPALVNLKTLRVQKNDLGDEMAVALADCPHIARLKFLTAYSNEIDDAGALAIARSPHLKTVGFIDLSRNRFDEGAARALEKRFGDRVNI